MFFEILFPAVALAAGYFWLRPEPQRAALAVRVDPAMSRFNGLQAMRANNLS